MQAYSSSRQNATMQPRPNRMDLQNCIWCFHFFDSERVTKWLLVGSTSPKLSPSHLRKVKVMTTEGSCHTRSLQESPSTNDLSAVHSGKLDVAVFAQSTCFKQHSALLIFSPKTVKKVS